jgi:hypothetical protein
MKVYIVYAADDSQFVEKLCTDLKDNGFKPQKTLPAVADLSTTIVKTDIVLVVLSDAITDDPTMIDYIERIKDHASQLIALRVGKVASMPESLRGTLPLDFSNQTQYDDSLETLVEDLEPPTVKLPRAQLLPGNIQEGLQSDLPQERLNAIQHISEIRTELDDNQRNYVEAQLRRIAFRDENGSVKTMARSTLQLLNAPTPASSPSPLLEDEDTERVLLPASVQDDALSETTQPTPAPNTTSATQQPAQPRPDLLVYSNFWWLLPIYGVLLALIQSALQRDALIGLPTALVWLTLPWFNLTIRDSGQLDWKMPGPLIANGVFGLIIAIVGGVLVLLLSDIEVLDFLLIGLLGTMYGLLIGWLSSLYAYQ